MGKFAIQWEKGRNTVDAETSLPNGFLVACTGFIYLPDSLLLHKIPGAYEVHDLPSGATNATTFGLAALRMRNHSYLLAATQGKLSSSAFSGEGGIGEGDFEPDEGGTGFDNRADGFGDWNDLQDRQESAEDFAFSGNFLKAIPDGRNRWIAWSGAEEERALVMDEDMNARMLGLRQPNAIVWPTPGDSSSGLVTNPEGETVTFRPDENNTTFTGRTAAGDFTWMNKQVINIPGVSSGETFNTNPWHWCMPQFLIRGGRDKYGCDSAWDGFRFRAYSPVKTETGMYVTTFGDTSLLSPPARKRLFFGTPLYLGDDDWARDVIGPLAYDGDPTESLTDPVAFSTDPENAYDGNSNTYTEVATVGSEDSPLVELDQLNGRYDGSTYRDWYAYTDRIWDWEAQFVPSFNGAETNGVYARRMVAVDSNYGVQVGNALVKAEWIRWAAHVPVYSVEYSFSAGHAQASELLEEHRISIDLQGLVNGGPGNNIDEFPWGQGAGAYKGSLRVEVSRDSGTTFAQSDTFVLDVGTTERRFLVINCSQIENISASDEVGDCIIRISFYNDSPLNNSESGLRIYDVKMQRTDGAGAGNVAPGTYWYAHTEKVTKTLADGTKVSYESEPSPPVSIIVDAFTYNGIKFNIPARKNVETMGISNDASSGMTVEYFVYRTTKSGAYPDLGKVRLVQRAKDEPTLFVDDFEDGTGGTILGTPTIDTVTSGYDTQNAAGEPPPIRDATLYRGSLVTIPANSPYELAWSMPGRADAFPNPTQRLKLLPSERNDELMGVLALNDVLVVFMQTRTIRLRELPFAGQSDYNLTRIERDVLSPNEGMPGTPLAYTTFELEDGRAMAAWISHNGIWMTDGSLVTERGMGVVKLTRYMDWTNTVDLVRLDIARLTYDPILQVLVFDYVDKDNNQKVVYFHTAPQHWLPTGKDQTVPKWTGPHPSAYNGYGRTLVERNGQLRFYTANDGYVYRTPRGDQGAGANIISYAETGFVYPAGPDGMFHIYDGTLEHTSWAREDQCTVEVTVRNDESGDIMHETITDLPLGGARQSNFWINMAGQAMKIALRHDGKTTSLTTPIRGIKTLQADGEVASDNAEQ